jgi:hypothetical protein
MKILLTPLLVSVFHYFSDNDKILENSKTELQDDANKHKIKVKKAVIYPTATVDSPDGSRYGFVH